MPGIVKINQSEGTHLLIQKDLKFVGPEGSLSVSCSTTRKQGRKVEVAE
jgi:hypothetical protein